MLAVRGGDLYALGVLFQRHRDAVHRLCARLIGDSATADDLVQETFLRILRYRHTFKGEARFTTWVYRIARNATMRHVERHGRRTEREAAAARELSIRNQAAGPNDHRITRLEEALEDLPLEQREAITLSRYHGLKYHEIAVVCECSVDAVKGRIYRAMQRLRRAFEVEEKTDGRLRAERG